MMNIMILLIIFSAIIGAFTAMIVLWIIGPISGAYFDAALTKKHISFPYVYSPFHSRRCMRGSIYFLLMITNGNLHKTFCKWWPKVIKPQKNTFMDFNYRAIARKRDWLLAIIFWSAMLISFISTIAGCILGALGK
jgi:hypothetical protein